MKNYSFSNITNEQSFGTRRSNDLSAIYRHTQLKGSEASLRIDEIKKKYDTPSRKQRIQSLKKSKEQQLFNRGKQQPKDPYLYKPSPNFGNNPLKQSFAVNRIEKVTLNKNDFDNKDFMNMRSVERSDRDYRRTNDKENVTNLTYKANTRQSEQAVFSKVREMKESILNNNYIKTSIGARPIKYEKYEGKREFDPRVENIDKINSKIKQILSCLSQNEKNPKYNRDIKQTNPTSFVKQQTLVKQPSFGVKIKQVQESNSKSYKNHSHKNSDVVEKYNILEPQESKQITVHQSILNEVETNTKIDSFRSKSYLDCNKNKNKEYSAKKIQNIAKEYQLNRKNKCLEQIIRTPTYTNKELKGSKSKNQLDSIKNSSHNDKSQNTLKSGKKLNDEISKIQKKIEEFQKEKRRLNIQFTPFSAKNKSTANLTVSFNGDKPTAQSKNVKQSLKNSQQSSKNSCLNHRSSSYDIKFKSYMNRAANYQQKYLNLTNIHAKEVNKNTSIYQKPKEKYMREGDFQLKIHQIEVKNVQVEKEVQHHEEESIKQSQIQIDEAAIKKRTDDGIQERRKIWKRQEDIITTETIKNMVKLFCEQVKLDQNLRNLKIWLQSSFDTDKFNKIAKFLEREGVSMNTKQCKTTFTLDQSQNNPFFSVQSFQGNFQSLAIAYLDAENHWKNKILHKFSRSSLSDQGFSSQKIDLQRKGYIQLQDLVRFLNIQSGTFYRNRDLFLIFRRFSPTERLKFDSLLNQICA